MPLEVHRTIPAPPDQVWALLVDLDAWPVWGPSVSRADLDPDHSPNGELFLGSRGRVWTPVGVPLPFEVVGFDPGRSWSWRVAGVPATTHSVEPHGDGARASMGAPVWAPAYLPVLALALRRLERLAVDPPTPSGPHRPRP